MTTWNRPHPYLTEEELGTATGACGLLVTFVESGIATGACSLLVTFAKYATSQLQPLIPTQRGAWWPAYTGSPVFIRPQDSEDEMKAPEYIVAQ